MPSSSAAIVVEQLHKTYRDGIVFRRSLDALKGVSLRIDRGEIFGLLGPNGAGKTTFVKVLLGIVRKTGGDATLLGRPAGSRASRKQVGYLPENLRIPRHLNARGALTLYGQLSGLARGTIKQRRDKLLDEVGLADRAGDSVKKYSKGMLQRLGLAIALLHEPELIFMDEPTDGLDPVGRTQVRHIMQQLKQQGKTIFLNSHLLQEVELVCDRVAILDEGIVRGIGTVDELVSPHAAGIELAMQLTGSHEIIAATLANFAAATVRDTAPRHVEARIRLTDQQEVDRCVDQLRQREISIVSLSPRKLTLEDAFMEIVHQNRETP